MSSEMQYTAFVVVSLMMYGMFVWKKNQRS
mgnify:FL=1